MYLLQLHFNFQAFTVLAGTMWHGGTVVMEILTAAIIIELLVLCTGVVSLETTFPKVQ